MCDGGSGQLPRHAACCGLFAEYSGKNRSVIDIFNKMIQENNDTPQTFEQSRSLS